MATKNDSELRTATVIELVSSTDVDRPHRRAVAIPAPTPEQRGTKVWLKSMDDLHRLLPELPRDSREYGVIEHHLLHGYPVVVAVMTTTTTCEDCGLAGALEEGDEFARGDDVPGGWSHFGDPIFRLCCPACANKRLGPE
jgi:hypothetical protein